MVVTALGGAVLGLVSDSGAAEQSPVVIPSTAESARVNELLKQFPGGDSPPVILLFSRTGDTPLSPADLAAAEQARDRALAAAGVAGGPPAGPPPLPVVPSADGQAALVPVALSPDLTGFALSDTVTELRTAAREGLPDGMVANVTGGPAFGADIANSFQGANFVLLGVTVGVVAVLLIVTYRSPVLWLVPLLVIAFADRVGALTGVSRDGRACGPGLEGLLGLPLGHDEVAVIALHRPEQLKTEEPRLAVDRMGTVGESFFQFWAGPGRNLDCVDLHHGHGAKVTAPAKGQGRAKIGG